MAVRVVGAVGDRTVADLEPGALGEESVAEREVPFGHRRHEVVGQEPDADPDRQQYDDLRNDAQDTDVTPRRHRGLLAGWEAGHLEGKISPGTDLDPPRGSNLLALTVASPVRRRVEEAAVGPQRVRPALQLERGAWTEVAV